MRRIFYRRPALGALGARVSDSRKLAAIHAAMRRRFPAVERVAVALYDAKTGTVGTFLAHEGRTMGPALYETGLAEAPSLRRVFLSRRIRVVSDLDVYARGRRLHTRAIRRAGFKSSATFPIVVDGKVEGFVFLDARRKNAFPPADLAELEVFARLAAQTVTARLRSASALRAALRTAVGLVHVRDPETGNHLERMARYSGVIARELARSGRPELDDERIRYIEEFAPLHDVGKIGIPDRILLKPGPLTPAERRVMETHTTKGRRIVDSILRRFAAEPGRGGALRQIAEHHHEAMDGSGYPHGLCGESIPLEARITSVADVFDALTSARSYKDAWPLDRAFAVLERLGRTRLDRECVRALVKNRREVELIRRRFADAGRLPLRRPTPRRLGWASRRRGRRPSRPPAAARRS